MNIFIELDTNPAKVIALYPDSISGRLSVPRAGWVPLFGGKAPEVIEVIKPTDSPVEGEEVDPVPLAEPNEAAPEPSGTQTPTDPIPRPGTPASITSMATTTTAGAKNMINKLGAGLLKIGGAAGSTGQGTKRSSAPNRPGKPR